MEDLTITIREIQHFLYCPHRWGLLQIDRAWVENAFVTKANMIHERVHSPDNKYTSRGKRVLTSVPIYSDRYNIYGVTDCIELSRSDYGIDLYGNGSKHKICIVEYKPTKPSNKDYHYEDMVQLFVQKVCVDEVFNCDAEVALYYNNVRQRIYPPIKEHYKELLELLDKVLISIRKCIIEGTIPEIKKGQNCSGCSMKDLCMPKIRKHNNIKQIIMENLNE
jgi:CRISPR-associated protein Cas4